MWLLYLLSWIATLVHVLFATLAIAAGLYYLAELVEEYTSLAAKVVRTMTLSVMGVYVLLFLFEDLPTLLIVLGLLQQLCHLALLTSFPIFTLTSPPFLLTLVLIVANHYLALQFFGEHEHAFSEVLAFFTLCLWLVPFAFFVSLSANEHVLPTTNTERRHLLSGDENDVVSHYLERRDKRFGLLSIINALKESVSPSRPKKAF